MSIQGSPELPFEKRTLPCFAPVSEPRFSHQSDEPCPVTLTHSPRACCNCCLSVVAAWATAPCNECWAKHLGSRSTWRRTSPSAIACWRAVGAVTKGRGRGGSLRLSDGMRATLADASGTSPPVIRPKPARSVHKAPPATPSFNPPPRTAHMLTGELRSRIDAIGNAFWSGGDRGNRADHLPAVPAPAGRPAAAGREPRPTG